MGQIIGGAAKPKRCNISQLSQLGTPAAGDYILVSSDNSMNAAGQGNFDCYVEGNGTTAATELPQKPVNKDILFNTYNILNIDKLKTAAGITYNDGVFSGLAWNYTKSAIGVFPVETTAKVYNISFWVRNTEQPTTTGVNLYVVVNYEDGTTGSYCRVRNEWSDWTFVSENTNGKKITSLKFGYSSGWNNVVEIKDIMLKDAAVEGDYVPQYSARDYVARARIDDVENGLTEANEKIEGTNEEITSINLLLKDGYVDLTDVKSGCILNTSVWSTGGSHVMIPVNKGSTITFVSSSAAIGIYAELESPDMDAAPVFIIPRTSINSNTTAVINITQDGYFYIHISAPNISINYTPASVYLKAVFSSIQEKTENAPAYNSILFAGSSSIQRMFNQTGEFSLPTLFDEYTLVNYGVGGEDIRAIGARMASEGLAVASDFTIPASGGVSGMTFSVRGQATSFTAQRGASLPALNPICIAGVWGNLSLSNNTYTFTRSENGESVAVKTGEIVIPYSVEYRKMAVITALGYNGGYSDADDYVSYHDNAARHLYDNRYIFMGILVVNGQWDNPTSEQLEIETKMLYRFGANYFNVRQWLSRYGIQYGIDMGLLDSSTYPTAQDITDMEAGVVPHSLRSDSAHLTDDAYKIVNKKVRELVELLSV